MTTATESFDRQVANSVRNNGFRPQLFTVVTGSYDSNAVYGSGAALLHDYNDEQLSTPLSQASIRQHDREVDFSLKLSLDLSQADPGFATDEELRIRTLQPLLAGEAARYKSKLPVSDTKYKLPLFLNVSIINPATGFPFAGFPAVAGVGQIQARLLYGGELALVVTDLTAGPPPAVTPLTAGDLAGLFGAGAGTQLEISIRGSYRGENHP